MINSSLKAITLTKEFEMNIFESLDIHARQNSSSFCQKQAP